MCRETRTVMEVIQPDSEQTEVAIDFYGVYLLYSINPQYLGRTYVGYTRDPTRRIAQHNRGTWAGGAHRTNNRGPWKMVMIIHGFPNNIAALRFEWAWQHPEQSTRLQHLEQPRRAPRKEKEFPYRLRILAAMLRAGPWRRLPLTIRWLEQDYAQPFPVEMSPPSHMIMKHGPVKSKNISKKAHKQKDLIQRTKQLCSLCYKTIDSENSKLRCLSLSCCLYFHLNCLANLFLSDGEYVPIDGRCPKCDTSMMWGDLIRNMKCGDSSASVASTELSEESDDDVEVSQEHFEEIMVGSSDDEL